ncbi:YhbP family protein [Shimwellia blattae]|uniref:UPF0306 protein EBL_c04350 n=1 Tax=Shimwellia blattae (strain ATCC 29907 / DSM 4481 / JCM 1650 / NBRC 105725 / CDC 9005-74) TaxID=630626 RepID=I2B4V7_SHIBC|nr:YhbP family protein [Shimwellia blattae]AFJ45561.1 hypothetical protein EBL_c04350 [Shimwellia blattae DSM 4481 = NBRC 105725]GAB81499.1 hypothetical protein YhbP [Shimwellia blattae DSM 4481 = NBRC 105725]VDY63043.1 Uncharacterized protein conserved in bacteria [Shimwellia blattae]VEC20186.1 Uncharacterized protein conserved in bacteria [Shimwellia blattae]
MSDSLAAISRWLSKQHVVTYCVARDSHPWCANAFYVYDPQRVALYLLTDPGSRHGQMAGSCCPVAGTVSGQNKTVALIRGVQFCGELRLLEGEEAREPRARYCRRFPVALAMPAPVWEIRFDELKFTDNTLGFGKKLFWERGGE